MRLRPRSEQQNAMSATKDKNPAPPEPRHFVLFARGDYLFALAIEDTLQVGTVPKVCAGKTRHRACLGFVEMHDAKVVLLDVPAAIAGVPARGPAPRMFVRLRTEPPTAIAADTVDSVCALPLPADSTSELVRGCLELDGLDVPLLDVEHLRRAAHGISVVSVLARRLEDIEA